VKNIPRSIRIFRVRLDGSPVRAAPALPLPTKPSIAVLPFQNRSGDPEQEYFAEAITEDLVTALSRWRWFFVIARNSSSVYKGQGVDTKQIGRDLGVRYLLEGSVRKIGNRVRVTVQLIDASNATHIWADRFDRDLVDVLALQDEITEQVVGAIEPAMLHSEGRRIAHKNLRDLDALDCFQRGMWQFNKMSEDGYRVSLDLFRQAIERDPELSLGYIGLARALYGGVIYNWSSQLLQDLLDAREAAQTAIRLDPRDAYGYFAASGASLYLRRHRDALDEARKTVALNPNFGFGHFRLGQVLVYSGRSAEAVEPIERSLRHSPYDPQLGAMFSLLSLAHFHAGAYPDAIREAEKAVRLHDVRAQLVIAVSLAKLGRLDEAHEAAGQQGANAGLAQMVQLAPYANEADRRDIVEALQQAGLESARL
jgi:adenylate cyclase